MLCVLVRVGINRCLVWLRFGGLSGGIIIRLFVWYNGRT